MKIQKNNYFCLGGGGGGGGSGQVRGCQGRCERRSFCENYKKKIEGGGGLGGRGQVRGGEVDEELKFGGMGGGRVRAGGGGGGEQRSEVWGWGQVCGTQGGCE